MPPRLSEQYQPGDRVQVYFEGATDPEWRPALVLGPQPPGIWVQTADGRHWFVTNGRRIRPGDSPMKDEPC